MLEGVCLGIMDSLGEASSPEVPLGRLVPERFPLSLGEVRLSPAETRCPSLALAPWY